MVRKAAMLILLVVSSVNAAALTIMDSNSQTEVYTIASLEQLPQSQITTELPWLKQSTTFTGVTLQTLLSTAKLKMPEVITFIALSNYRITIPRADFEKYQPIIAYKMNNQLISVSDKGPFWLIFPLSTYPEINNIDFHAKMIWQIKEIYL